MSKVLQLCKKPIFITQCRSFFYWIDLQFNAVDEERRKQVGPDRVCAEWILRNGGKVKWSNNDYESDYNRLPDDNIKFRLQEIDASDSSIMTNGFEHLNGCNYINKIILHKCNYLENKALAELHYVKDTLQYLQVSSCGNITEEGLLYLAVLHKLKQLLIFDLPYVKDKTKVVDSIQKSLPQCKSLYQ